ncbi:hypothetical protein M5D96_013500 [Drosophila gunungcola]|uniref:Ig-like domain-containing protein n=1 Tax=Drosophila gunungcola TaxID=103775 RepID=A0A9P9YC05_9MUSC|nr:hypothetical protein M5D96_013500 [Drosophila gunungcola]
MHAIFGELKYSGSVSIGKVSWVRHRDIHLLTVGRYTYTSDQRFEAMHSPHAEDWTLRIRYAQRKDSGIYECQISTTPPIGHSVYLNIVEPVTDIIGGPDLHINRGSTINLTCIVKFAPEPPPTVVWSHNREIINFDSPRGGISLVTEKGVLTTSRLLVQKAITQDSGLYTCTPSNANPSSVRVHIVDALRSPPTAHRPPPTAFRPAFAASAEAGKKRLQSKKFNNLSANDFGVRPLTALSRFRFRFVPGEHPAAMHTGNNGNSTAPQPPVLLPLVLLTCGTLMLLQLVACCCSAAALVPATPPGRSNVHRPGTTLTKDTARGQRSTRNCQTLGEAGFFQKEDLCRRGFEIRPVPGT